MLKSYYNFLLEYKEDLETIYNKYYRDIDYEDFKEIVGSDPTSLRNNRLYLGKYSKWLLNLFRKNSLKIEDLYKATKYLSILEEFKHKINLGDINKIKSLPELYLKVKDFEIKDEEIYSDDERKLKNQYKEVFKNDKYRIIIPLTLEASKYFGRQTEWCTTHEDMFKHYTKNQTEEITYKNLYILYTEDLDERLQFHFKERQFMDINDEEINLEKFFEENKDIHNFFNKYFNPIRENVRWNKNTLKGSPEKVEGSFYCNDNELTDLQGAPEKVEGVFDCRFNNLKSLKGAPKIIEGNFNCFGNENLKDEDFKWLEENCQIKGEINK